MTKPVTTNRILAERALRKTCGQQCVDWAIGLLESGRDGEYLTRLAAMAPPYNHFEIADLRDRTLLELGIADLNPEQIPITYAKELLESGIADEKSLIEAVALVSQLHIDFGYPRELTDFYLLDNAHDDLVSQDVQWYWDGATKENIVSLMKEKAEQFIVGN